MSKLAFAQEENNGWNIVRLNGDIVEGSKSVLKGLENSVGQYCIFDFRNVSSINTCGIAEWIEFLGEFEKDRSVLFDACSSNIVMLINMVPAFQGSAEIRSLYRTYFCDACAKTVEVAVVKDNNMPTVAGLKENPEIDDEIKCGQCPKAETLEAEVPSEEFYEFLNKD